MVWLNFVIIRKKIDHERSGMFFREILFWGTWLLFDSQKVNYEPHLFSYARRRVKLSSRQISNFSCVPPYMKNTALFEFPANKKNCNDVASTSFRTFRLE